MATQLRSGFISDGLPPNRFKSAQFSEPIISQAEIDIDYSVDPHLAQQRSIATRDSNKIPRDQFFGTDLGENFEYVDVKSGEPLLMHKGSLVTNGQEKFFPKKNTVFSSLNGSFILGKRDGISQEEFEAQYEFAGISNVSVTFGAHKESTMKCSGRVAGSGTLENNGNDTFSIGDDVAWCLHSIDPDTRSAELAALPNLQYKDKHKMGIVWRRLSFSDSTHYLQHALTLTFDNQWSHFTNDFSVLVDEDRREHVPETVRIGLLLRALVAFASWNGVVHAIERGWVRANTPADFTQYKFNHNYDSPIWAEIDKHSPEELSRGKVDYSEETRELRFHPPSTLSPTARVEQSRIKQFLAAKHGFLSQNDGNLAGNSYFLDTITARTLRSLIISPQVYEGGDISAMFDAERTTEPMFSDNQFSKEPKLSDVVGALSAIQSRVGLDVYLASVQARNKIYSRKVLKAMTPCRRGEKFVYMLTMT